MGVKTEVVTLKLVDRKCLEVREHVYAVEPFIWAGSISEKILQKVVRRFSSHVHLCI